MPHLMSERGELSALSFDNAPDMSNLLGLFLGQRAQVEPTMETVQAEKTCFDKCMEGRFSIASFCRFSCGLEEKSKGPIEQFRNLLIIVIGLVLVIVVLALLTR